jgi:hypothetical protein
MADDERDEPSLELPSFGLGRRRARKDRFLEPDPLTAPLEQVEPEERVAAAPAEEPAEVAAEPAVVPAARPLFVEETADAPAVEPVAGTGVESGGARRQRRQDRPRRPERPTRPPRSPGGVVAVLLTGLLVGVLVVALTLLSQRGCAAVQGTSSCGEPGLLLLLAILVASVLLGATALRLARVPDPGSTSFLGVGLLTVLALLFLVGSLFEWWAAVAVPVLSVLTFGLSHWVTTSITGDEETR